MKDHAGNIKKLAEALVCINEAKQSMAMLDQKIRILQMLEKEMVSLEKWQARIK